MARGTPACSKGSVGAVVNGQRRAVMELIRTRLLAYDVSGNDTWVESDTYNSGGYDYHIFHSQGSPLLGGGAGDADLWILLQEYASGIYCRTMSDFCPAANTYQRQTSNSGSTINITDTGAFDWWSVVNDYEFTFVMVQGGTYYAVWGGQPLNGLGEGSAIGGRARLSVATSTTGNGIVLSLDRDLTGLLTVGQKIYLLNQTPDGAGALSNDFCEIVTVAAVGSSTVTVDGVVNQPYQIGSLVGLYPFCCSCAASGSSFLGTIYSSIFPNATTGAATSGTITIFFASGFETNMDPDFAGIYRMGRVYIGSGSSLGYYGVAETLLVCPLGAQAAGDRMLIDNSSAKAYWVFPALIPGAMGGGCTCIGPGATV